MSHSILDRVSYHAVYDASILDALQYAKHSGFAGIQVADETPHLSFERLSDADIEQIADFVALQGQYITLHAPDDAASLFQCSRYLNAGIMDYYRALLSFGRSVCAKLVTIHVGSMTVFPADTDPEQRIPQEDRPLYETTLRRNLEDLMRMTKDTILLCVENYAMDSSILDLLVPYLKSGDLFLCWDLVKSASRPELEDFLFSNISWVKQVHLHDRRAVSGSKLKGHRTISTGDIDFPRYLRALAPARVEDFCIEVRPREKAKESLDRLTSILGHLFSEPTTPADAQ